MSEITKISINIPLAALAEIDAAAAELGCSRTEIIRARLRWAVAMERVMSGQEAPPLALAAE